MSVQLKLITAMKMPPVIAPVVALSVPAMLVLMEMESTVQVRLIILSWSKRNLIMYSALLIQTYLYASFVVSERHGMFCCCFWVSQLLPFDPFNRHQ